MEEITWDGKRELGFEVVGVILSIESSDVSNGSESGLREDEHSEPCVQNDCWVVNWAIA